MQLVKITTTMEEVVYVIAKSTKKAIKLFEKNNPNREIKMFEVIARQSNGELIIGHHKHDDVDKPIGPPPKITYIPYYPYIMYPPDKPWYIRYPSDPPYPTITWTVGGDGSGDSTDAASKTDNT